MDEAEPNNEVAGWTGNRRPDGVTIMGDETVGWAIFPVKPNLLPIAVCPCCGARLMSARAAKLVANEVFPIEDRQ
jgi:hypothetical protein